MILRNQKRQSFFGKIYLFARFLLGGSYVATHQAEQISSVKPLLKGAVSEAD
jgi:hypothetical protein